MHTLRIPVHVPSTGISSSPLRSFPLSFTMMMHGAGLPAHQPSPVNKAAVSALYSSYTQNNTAVELPAHQPGPVNKTAVGLLYSSYNPEQTAVDLHPVDSIPAPKPLPRYPTQAPAPLQALVPIQAPQTNALPAPPGPQTSALPVSQPAAAVFPPCRILDFSALANS